MEHLDDHIREQFQQDDPARRFPFREEHWTQALALIEAAERKRRRRGLLWWWFAGLLLLGGGWWGWRQSDRAEAADLHRPTAPGSALHPAQPAYESGPGADGGQHAAAAGAPERAPGNTESQPAAGARQETAPKSPSPTQEKKPFRVAGQSRGGEEKAGRQTTASVEQKTAMPTVPVNPLLSEAADPAAVNDLLPNQPDPSAGSVVEITATDPGFSATRPHRAALVSLPAMVQPLTHSSGGFGLAQVPYHFPRIRPVRTPVFALGLAASAAVYHPAPAGRQWGATVGGYAEYWFRPSWSLAAGLQWRKQPVVAGSTDTLTAVRQLRYRFGYEEETFHRADRSLHFLEVPLGLHWHHRAWQLQAGAALGRLIGVRSVLIQTTRNSLAPGPIPTEQRIRGERVAWRRNYFAPFAGMAWQPLRRLQLEIRATYRPASLLRPTAEDPYSTGSYWLDAGVRWQLCSHDKIRLMR